jgi:hypothetical protein
MTSPKANLVAIVLGTLGILFFIAMGLGVIPGKWAIFAGIACFILAGMTRRLAGQR